ncbi:MAG: hypothetical protein SPK76_05075 [Bacteroidales bacterium]|nr:hypothetical protein [Bacteroidales bacterium]
MKVTISFNSYTQWTKVAKIFHFLPISYIFFHFPAIFPPPAISVSSAPLFPPPLLPPLPLPLASFSTRPAPTVGAFTHSWGYLPAAGSKFQIYRNMFYLLPENL